MLDLINLHSNLVNLSVNKTHDIQSRSICYVLEEMFKTRETLETLNLNCSSLSASLAKHISEGLCKCKSLKSLFLFSTDSTKSLVEIVKTLQCSVCLENVEIEVQRSRESIKEFESSEQMLGHAIASMISKNSNLKKLHFNCFQGDSWTRRYCIDFSRHLDWRKYCLTRIPVMEYCSFLIHCKRILLCWSLLCHGI